MMSYNIHSLVLPGPYIFTLFCLYLKILYDIVLGFEDYYFSAVCRIISSSTLAALHGYYVSHLGKGESGGGG